jgi:hypothetical protein
MGALPQLSEGWGWWVGRSWRGVVGGMPCARFERPTIPTSVGSSIVGQMRGNGGQSVT